ncbi:hypothetical protein ACO0RG_004473 [Hanseniaspora osmophila]
MSNTSLADLSKIQRFIADAEIKLSENVEIKETSYGGLGVFALEDLEPGQILARIPKKSCFTAQNSSIANLLVDADVAGYQALSISFVYEVMVFKERSHWFNYVSTIQWKPNGKLYLPPAYWSKKEKKWLKGTTLDVMYDALSPQDAVEGGFEIALELAKKWNEDFGLEIPDIFLIEGKSDEEIYTSFLEFASIGFALSSRAFEIDNYHQHGLVGVADIFNHCDDPDVHFVSNYDVCSKCGEAGECRHLIAEAYLEAQQDEPYLKVVETNDADLYKLIEQLEEEEKEKEEEEVEDEDVEDAEDDEEDDDDDDEEDDEEEDEEDEDEFCDMTLVKPVKKGNEVFSNYGDLSNVILVSKYGFFLNDNPKDVVSLLEEVKSYMHKHRKQLKDRIEWWQDEGYKAMKEELAKTEEIADDESESDTNENGNDSQIDSDDDHEDDDESSLWLEEMNILHNGEVSKTFKLIAKLFSLRDAEWRKFQTLKSDHKKFEILSSHTKDANAVIHFIVSKKTLFEIPKTCNENIEKIIHRENELITKAQKLYT